MPLYSVAIFYEAPSATVSHFGYACVIQYQHLFVGVPYLISNSVAVEKPMRI
jgi:hypothetical protein